MTVTDDDDNQEWEFKPDQEAPSYAGNDLSRSIATGEKVCKLREKAGLSAQEIEDYAGVPKANVLAIEAGLLELDKDTAESLATVLGVSVAALIS